MGLSDLKDVTYFRLNNEINRPVNGQIPLHKDKEALEAFFVENVEPNTLKFATFADKLNYLLTNNYIDKAVTGLYSIEFMEELLNFINGERFRFKSFMAAYKFYQQYAQKTDDGEYYLESVQERVLWNALFLAQGDESLAKDIANEMVNQRYQPATPTFMNAGRARRGEFISCFELSMADDLNSIGRTVNSALQLSARGGGVGILLSNIREAGSPIKGMKNASSGIVPIMKIFEDAFSYANQLGQRQGACAVYVSIAHPDIVEFLSTKKENADEKVRVKTLSLGLVVPDKFYEKARNNEDWFMFSPYSVEKEYGLPFAHVDISAEYDNLVNNPNIAKKKVNARWLEEEISKLQQESGYPYIINIDTANRASAVTGKILMSNLCSEILQTQTPSKIRGDQTYEELGDDVSCNLGSANIYNLMRSPDFGKSVRTMVRALNTITDQSNIEEVPTIRQGNEHKHSIGLGSMGLASYLANEHVYYGSDESIEFTDIYFMLLNYWTLVESNVVAKERGETFFRFDESTYADGTYFDKYVTGNFKPKSEKVKAMFKDIHIPTAADWIELRKNVIKYGLYNETRLAVAPNGSISYVNDTSASIHPIVQRVEERQEKKVGKIYYPAFGLSTDTLPYYQSAYDIDMRKVIDVYAAATQHVDQGLSLTLFMRSELPEGMYEWKTDTNKMTTRDLTILRHYAFNKGIKSIYYIRTYTENNEEIGANSCESCVI